MTVYEPAPAALPASLRERVLAASRQARPAGRPTPEVAEISAAEAYSRAADAFNGLLCVLDEADWQRPVLRDLDVQGLVGHLTGVEEDMHRGLSGDRAVAAAEHVESTQPAALRQAGSTPGQTRAEWRRSAERTLRLVDEFGDSGAEVAVHRLRLPLSALLIARAFELWTHENDIRRAAGRPASVPDPPTLRLMTGLAARLLPHAAARSGLRDPVTLRLVLTGPGGGTWDIALGEGPPGPRPSASSPARSGSAAWSPTGPPPPTLTCSSPATLPGPPAYSPRPHRSRSINPLITGDPAAITVAYPSRKPCAYRRQDHGGGTGNERASHR